MEFQFIIKTYDKHIRSLATGSKAAIYLDDCMTVLKSSVTKAEKNKLAAKFFQYASQV